MQTVDTCIQAGWVLPINPQDKVYQDHSVIVHNDKIIDVLPNKEAGLKYAAMHRVALPEHVLMPGLVNCHNHSPMTLFRGLADDLPLMTWLNDHIWPAESKWVREDFVEHGSLLAMAEMIRSGSTCFNDMYFFPNITGRVAKQVGMRAALGLLLMDFPTPWAKDPDEYLEKAVHVYDELKGHPLLTFSLAPHAPYTVSDEPLTRLRTMAEQLDLAIHMHIHETQQEVDEGIKQHGMRPLARLEGLGLLSPRLQAVHMTALDDDDIKRVEHNGVNIIHCPESNMKLASGICPTTRLLEKGINLGLGTDGAASNNDLDMFGEMRSAALLAKVDTGNAEAFSAKQALYSATLGGAKVLGLEDKIGSIEVGKQADLIAVDMNAINCWPNYHLHSQLVYAANSKQVTHVWIHGKTVMADSCLTTIDEDKLKTTTLEWQQRILDIK